MQTTQPTKLLDPQNPLANQRIDASGLELPNVVQVDSLDNELLEPYLGLRSRNWTRQSGIFIAEGPLLVDRVIASSCHLHSILLDRKYLVQYIDRFPKSVPVLLVDHDLIEQLVGFNFHRGVLACGRRTELKPITNQLCFPDHSETWIGLIGVQDPENVGGILRSAAGLGVKRVLIGPGTADPFSRRALRVSMGNVLALELFESRQPLDDLKLLYSRGMEVISTSLGANAVHLETAQRTKPLIILFGNEKHGLDQDVLSCSNRCVQIEMLQGTDSLNVSAAAAITIHHFLRLCGSKSKSDSSNGQG